MMRRAPFLSLHRWLGLALAPFLAIQALTGTLLVLHELSLPDAPLLVAPPSALIAAAERAGPGFHVKRLFLPGSTGSTVFAEMTGPAGATRYAELAPGDGAVIAQGPLWRFPYRAAVQVHYRLAAGAPGMVLVTALGLGLATLALAGLAVWWPGLGRIGPALKGRRGLPARLRLRQWHRTSGALVAGLALFSAATGVLLLAPDLPGALAPAAPATPPVARLTPQALDRAVAAAQAQFPNARLRDIRLPPADRIDVNLDAPERHPRAVHAVAIRPSDGRVLKAVPALDNPVLWMKVLPLHTGEAMPLIGPALLLIEAGALLFLIWAGLRLWLGSRRKAPR